MAFYVVMTDNYNRERGYIAHNPFTKEMTTTDFLPPLDTPTAFSSPDVALDVCKYLGENYRMSFRSMRMVCR